MAKLLGCLTLLIALVATFFCLKYRDQQIREQTWESATATITDARPTVWMRVDSHRGGAMAYRVEVLARYEVNGSLRQQWTTVSSQPWNMDEARMKSILLKGKTCIVRWKPLDPSHLVAEIS